MSILLTRSKVKAEQVAEVEAGIKRLVPALQQAHVEDMRYAWFRLDDGVTFVILVEYGEGESNPAANLPEYQAFMEILKVSIEGPPTTEELTVSGSYRVF
jgi:quinol monooxygenase YgiN